ncbi:hypothetical protein S245_013050, partial [Arachis hypogaea]
IQRAGALNIKVLSTTLDKVEFNVTALGDPAKDRRVEVDRDSLIYKRWTKNAKNEFISREMPVNDDIERSRKQGKSTPNVNVEGINDPFVVKSKGAPSKRSSWRKKRACSNCHKYDHYYKRCPNLMQHSVEGNPRDRSDGNASAKDSVKSEHHSGPKTK